MRYVDKYNELLDSYTPFSEMEQAQVNPKAGNRKGLPNLKDGKSEGKWKDYGIRKSQKDKIAL